MYNSKQPWFSACCQTNFAFRFLKLVTVAKIKNNKETKISSNIH